VSDHFYLLSDRNDQLSDNVVDKNVQLQDRYEHVVAHSPQSESGLE
jgi:hypothetical protein